MGKWKMRIEFWKVNLLESGYLDDQEGDRKLILKWIVEI
jgi:hypothetical protein